MDKLFSNLQSGATLLTVNSRLSRHLQMQYDQWQVSIGSKAWKTPQIYPYQTWIKVTFNNKPVKKKILSDWKELLIWESIINGDLKSLKIDLLNLESAARKVMSAYDLYNTFRLRMERDNYYLTEENRAFLRWKERFDKLCDKQGFVPLSKLVDSLISSMEQSNEKQFFIFAGFDDFTPQQQELISTLKLGGGVRQLVTGNKNKGKIYCNRFSIDEEVQALVLWAKDIILKNSDTGVGVIVPNLANYSKTLKHAFKECLTPKAILPGNNDPLPVNISVEGSLKEEGIITTAFEVLNCNKYGLNIDTVEHLLLSPYSGGSNSLALLDFKLKKNGFKKISLLKLAEESKNSSFSERCKDLYKTIKETSDYPGCWAEHFALSLKAFKWPLSSTSLTSREFQAVKAFNDLLDEFAGLDGITGKISREKGISLLKRMAGKRMFQPEGSNSPVQVMGVLESAGMEFDHLWVLGVDESAFPSPANPNPFLPLDLQRSENLPHSSANKELEFAKKTLNRLFQSAPEIIFSYPYNSEGADSRPSALIAKYPKKDFKFTYENKINLFGFSYDNEGLLNKISDFKGPAIEDSTKVEGGSSIIKDQSACPFKAFATHRLKCSKPDEIPDLGLKSSERGSLIHKAMEVFWEEVKTHTGLCAMKQDELEKITSLAVKNAINIYNKSRMPEQYKAAEILLTKKLIIEFLKIEKERINFSIEELEKRRDIELAGMSISVMVDRVDLLSSGSIVLIDYKTGTPKSENWDGERPQEPQLPLYCCGFNKEVDAIAFAQVKKSECKYIGQGSTQAFTSSNNGFKFDVLTTPLWQERVKNWRINLEKIAQNFLDGDASVDPFDQTASCKYCFYPTLCRINDFKK